MAVLTLLVAVSGVGAVDIDDLKPGLVATYRDNAARPVEIVRIEPTISAYWKAGEAAHPRLAGDSGTVEWDGYISILRTGNYQFSVRLRGDVVVTVAGHEVLSRTVKGNSAELVQGPEKSLPAGPQPIKVKFTRPATGTAQLELRWQAAYFRAEPVPYDHLFHLPKSQPPAAAANRSQEQGRFLFEELSCIKCHLPDPRDRMASGLVSRTAPDLTFIGTRTNPGWIYHWLSDPQKFRPGAVMPRMFGDDQTGKVEVYAISRFLASLVVPDKPGVKRAPPPKADPKEVQSSIKRGEELFGSVGCVACHAEKPREPVGMFGDPRNYPLGAMGSKTRPEILAAYLVNPLAIDPSGRMPDMLLDAKEALDLARFLCTVKDKTIPTDLPPAPDDAIRLAVYQRLQPAADDLASFQKLDPADQWLALGQRLVIARGCTTCHTINSAGKPLPAQAARTSFDTLKTGKSLMAGCLADDPGARGPAPLFLLNEQDRKVIRVFLLEGTTGAGSPSPMHAGRLTLHRFNCFACHSRNGKGGLTPETIEDLRRFEKAENAEAVTPPPLTGIGHKLRTPWLRQVLLQKGRARPWMGLRMPQFGEANVGHLVDGFSYLEGIEPDDRIHEAPLTAVNIDQGKHLVGKNAFGCIACHDLAGIPNHGTRGPDLAFMKERVRYDWYVRWLEQPQKMQPGTRMPTVFPDGKTTLPTVLNGNVEKQAEAMWAYLSLGPTLPLPAGLEPKLKGRIVTVADQPVVLRCFMPDVGPRTIAVGYPGSVNIAYDAGTCRTVQAWSGNFLDASPIWDNRGGSPVKILGPRYWTSPAGHPWALTPVNNPPDFTAQAKDPAWGATLPDNKVFHGVKQLQFAGYSLDAGGAPTFRYLAAAGEKEPMTVTEKPEPLRSPVAVGVKRTFTLSIPPKKFAWFLAGETTGKVRALTRAGGETPLDNVHENPLTDLLIVPQGQQVQALRATAPMGSAWRLLKEGGTTRLVLRLPASFDRQDVQVTVEVWSAYRNDPSLLKELVAGK